MTSWFRPDGEQAFCLSLHLQPGAKKNEVVGPHGDALKIRLTAPPVDGKANNALLTALADWLDLPRNRLTLERGQTSRHKVVRVEGTTVSVLRALASRADDPARNGKSPRET